MTRIAIATLGCKTNAYESAAIVGQFDGQDVLVVPFDEPADLYIINTCTVTNRTDFKSRNLIRKLAAESAQSRPRSLSPVTRSGPRRLRLMGAWI